MVHIYDLKQLKQDTCYSIMLTRKGFVIQKKDYTFSELQKLKADLTVSPFQVSHQQAEKFPMYQETENVLRIPRFYGIRFLGLPKIYKIPDGISINISFNGTLKDELHQVRAVETTINQIRQTGGALLSLPTGYGKTSCALYIACVLKRKTLIIVHKTVLLDQWKERIQQFIPEASIGIVKQNKVDVEGKDIVIGMLQSISLKEYNLERYNFGFVIIDETHHICSKLFSQSMFRICPKYVLGLSATPQRKDGLTKVLFWFLNEISFYVEREESNCSVQIYDSGFETDEIIFTRIINEMVLNEERNQYIIDMTNKFKDENRNILILSDRRNHCEILQTKISNSGLYLGGMKKCDLAYNEQHCQVLLATYSLAAEGLDIPRLDTLILATPKGDVVQACGRILRETPGKLNNPYILDIVDDIPLCKKLFQRRKRYYKKSFQLL